MALGAGEAVFSLADIANPTGYISLRFSATPIFLRRRRPRRCDWLTQRCAPTNVFAQDKDFDSLRHNGTDFFRGKMPLYSNSFTVCIYRRLHSEQCPALAIHVMQVRLMGKASTETSRKVLHLVHHYVPRTPIPDTQMLNQRTSPSGLTRSPFTVPCRRSSSVVSIREYAQVSGSGYCDVQ
jgi:hypothetical protein